LKEEGLINDLSTGTENLLDLLSTFDINMDLTEKGLKHIDWIISYIFEYIEIVKEKGI